MSDIEANRLTTSDRERMRTAVAETLARWDTGARQLHGPGARQDVGPIGIEALERIARHVIGCGTADLRDAELDEIAGMVLSAVSTHNGRRTYRVTMNSDAGPIALDIVASSADAAAAEVCRAELAPSRSVLDVAEVTA